ncbi:hypothetical protein [Psychroflexus sp. ALD_RP9]|uniref:hypothetical protein n=1 Tax=Psychroflexus sp. ALD_RP9 TaxID=2777186 RepID=UPI001A8E0180|nr:hypothetical protein [Psychroflexus sp. ALD_RP9]QSS97428.1 hypothetical protein IMZ30_01565 [Psychroflexus sp. ALD_RP9]
MNYKFSFLIICFSFSTCLAQIDDFNQVQTINLEPNLSILEDPFSIKNLPQPQLLNMVIDLNANPFQEKRQINMVAATARKAQSQNYNLSEFNFVERQLAIFRKERPRLNNSIQTPFSPDYHDQLIYSGSNRVNNEAFRANKTFQTPKYINNLYYSPYRRHRGFWQY